MVTHRERVKTDHAARSYAIAFTMSRQHWFRMLCHEIAVISTIYTNVNYAMQFVC